MRKYRLVAKKGEGTFSEVLKAQNVKDGKYHAIKCMKNRFESIDQVNNLREIQALRRLSPHEHIISLEEVLYDQPTGRLALVFELMDANLYELIRGRKHYLNPSLIKSYMWQLMKSLDHMHKKGIFHRDIKPENILIESSTEIGRGLKLADFGSCRGIYSKQPYTEYISTRWYRAPECLLTDGYYGPEMDLWGAGCVMFEITSLYPLFPGANEVDQISRIHKVLGTPTAESLAKFRAKGASHISFDFPQQKGIGIPQLVPHASADSIDLMVKLLKYDASDRITAREAMRHNYFKDVREAEAKQAAEKQAQIQQQQSSGATVATNQAVAPPGGLSTNSSVANTSVSQSNHYNYSNENNASNSNTKNLPNIGVNSVNEQKSIMGTNSNIDLQMQYQQQLLAKQQSQNAKMGMPLANTIAAASSLPPITGNTMNSAQQSKYVEQKSARTMVQPSVSQKKRKNKYRPAASYTQQEHKAQVLNAYGVSNDSKVFQGKAGSTSASEKGGAGSSGIGGGGGLGNNPNTYGLMVGGSSSSAANGPSSNSSNVGAYGHPNRNYVQQKK